MDPLSFIASLLTVIHGARLGIKGVQKLKTLRNAPKELDRFWDDLRNLEALLENVRKFVERNPSMTYCDILSAPVTLASEKINTINQILYSPAFGLSHLSKDIKARLNWTHYKHRLTILAKDINRIKAEIGICLGLVTAGQIEVSVKNLFSHHDNILQQMSSLLDRMPSSVSEAIQHTFSSEQTSTNGSIQETDKISQGQDEKASSSADVSLKDPKSTEDQHTRTISSNDPGLLAAGNPLSKKQTCRSGCSCTCHLKRNFNTPKALSSLFGELRIQYNGRSMLLCNCSTSSSFRISYLFPRYFLLRYISLVAQLHQIAGPEYLLRVPRVLPPYHVLWHYAVQGDIAAVQSMYSQRLASPYDVNNKNATSLFYAVRQKTPKLALCLLDQGVDFEHADDAGLTPGDILWDRAFGGHYGAEGSAVIRRLLKGDQRIDDMGFTTLHKIVLGFNHKVLQAVLEASTDSINTMDFKGRTPLHWAVLRDDQTAVQELLGNGADPNITDRGGLVAIDLVRSGSVCETLLKAGSNINNPSLLNNRCALHHAVNSDAPIEIIGILIAAGSDVNFRDSDGETALMIAIYWGYIKTAKCLIHHGAEVNVSNFSCDASTVYFAAAYDRPEILPLLLPRGADYNTLNIYGHDLGHVAALFAGVEFINIMAQSGLERLSLDVRDKVGKTAKDLMKERPILTDREIGVHEAFEALGESLSTLSELKEKEEDLNVDRNVKTPDFSQLPGSFPQSLDIVDDEE